MKRYPYLLIIVVYLFACTKSDTKPDTSEETYKPCGKHTSGQDLFKGSKGGCFYYNGNGNKTYVDRNECNC